MSKPIDQEREAFDLAYQCAVDNGWESTKELARYMWDQARAQQPAGVAVPDENDCVVGGYAFLAIRGKDELHVTVDPTERLAKARADHWREKGFVCGVKPIKIPVSMLAAPHPVSSEQKVAAYMLADAVGGSCLEFQESDLHDLQRRYGGEIVKLYTAPPAAQDVAGLVEAVHHYLSAVHEQLPNPLKVTAAMLQMKKALAAHRAQQGEQKS